MEDKEIVELINKINQELVKYKKETLTYRFYCSEETWRHFIKSLFPDCSDELLKTYVWVSYEYFNIIWIKDESLDYTMVKAEKVEEND